MEPNKNIDRLFQEKLRDLEVTPPDIVWDNIDAHLNGKKKRRVIPFWLRFAGVAAIIFLATMLGVKFLNSTPNKINNENIIVDIDSNNTPILNGVLEKDSNTIQPTINNSITDVNDKKLKKSKKIIISSSSKTSLTSSEGNSNQNKKNISSNTSTNKNSSAVYSNPIKKGILVKSRENPKNHVLSETNKSSLEKDAIVSNITKKTIDKDPEEIIEEEIAYENIQNLEDTLDDKYKVPVEEKEKAISKRWSIASVVAPVFYNSFNSKGSPLDLQFQNNPKEGSQSISYGVKVGYQISNKFSLQSGLTLVNVGYTIDDIYINPSPSFSSRLANVNYDTSTSTMNVNANNLVPTNQNETARDELISGSLNQEYGYVEIPLELKYSLTNGKLGVHIIGGFSTLFLNNNEVYVNTLDFSSNIGEAKNLNDLNFSGNIGFDIDYKINQSLFINVAPMLKVYTNTFSKNSDNFNPYLFGVYTGLNYRF